MGMRGKGIASVDEMRPKRAFYLLRRVAEKFRYARRMRPRDLLLFAESWFAIAYAKFRLRVLPHGFIERAMKEFGGDASPSDAELQRLARIFRLAVRNFPVEANCLPQSLALAVILRRRAVAHRMVIGGRRNGQRLDGHAWIEVGGVPLNDRPDAAERFPPLRVSPQGVKTWTTDQ